MSTRKTPFENGEFYHIYNRGVDKNIFSDSDDLQFFRAWLNLCCRSDRKFIRELLSTWRFRPPSCRCGTAEREEGW